MKEMALYKYCFTILYEQSDKFEYLHAVSSRQQKASLFSYILALL